MGGMVCITLLVLISADISDGEKNFRLPMIMLLNLIVEVTDDGLVRGCNTFAWIALFILDHRHC